MSSTIRIAIADTIRAGLELLSPAPNRDVTLLPSSLRRNDQAAAELRAYFRHRGRTSHLLVPVPLIAGFSRPKSKDWRKIMLPGVAGEVITTVVLPGRLVDSECLWSITDIDAVSGRGPYVLDLPARYTDTTTRLRIVASKRRAEIAVAILQARPFERQVLVRHFPSFEFIAICDDPIAAELLALSLVDEDLTRDHQVAGPWEDDLVQRATELDLGARLPRDITVETTGPRDGPVPATLGRILGRIGIDFPR